MKMSDAIETIERLARESERKQIQIEQLTEENKKLKAIIAELETAAKN